MVMNIDVSKNGKSLLVTVSGRIDPTTASEFEKAIMENLDGVQVIVTATAYEEEFGKATIFDVTKGNAVRRG